ncbi:MULTISPECIES: hypothetical protein [unclassified Nocardia]|uniref:hypothetical protein n=1 Tax=unclassified Nocardia TaxID=2637762 RepID=UPI0024A951D8|nr:MULTISPECIES: hypothetical protein [unclassified Nocardia]
MSMRVQGPMLHPRYPVLVRRDGGVQVGWDPGRALILRLPGVDTQRVLAFLRLLDGLCSYPRILWRARELGIEADTVRGVLAEMRTAGLLAGAGTERVGGIRLLGGVHLHGRGPLSDALLLGLRRMGMRPSHSRGQSPPTAWRPQLVVLADTLVPAPDLVERLVRLRIPHVQVCVRDGRGIIGPLVLPGVTSCLSCADRYRADREPEWPHLAAQLLGRVGQASAAGIAATAGLALAEIEAVAAGEPDRPPTVLNATLELNLDSRRLDRRTWPPHPSCHCRKSPVQAEV